MSEDTLVRFCAPTLAGIKSANLFSCEYTAKAELLADVRRLNRILTPKGLRLIPLRIRQGKALVYLYRPDRLEKDLHEELCMELLLENGYEEMNVSGCLGMLRRKLHSQEDFPHKIGLFLSYPPEDVRGFIHNGASRCKMTGCWKVYGDTEKAEKIFRRYHLCRESYSRQWGRGVEFSRLVVSAF